MQTFDGERCLYAALNDAVSTLLLNEGFAHAGSHLRLKKLEYTVVYTGCHRLHRL